MKPERMNQVIHEQIRGLCWHRDFAPHYEHPGCLSTCGHCPYSLGSMQAVDGAGVPDYTTDLNAVALAEAEVCAMVGFSIWSDSLRIVVRRDFIGFDTLTHEGECGVTATANALQRSEAVLRAAGKWGADDER